MPGRVIPQPGAGGAPARAVAYVYLLRSYCDGTYYVGWTTEPVRRLGEHNAGQSTFTRRKRPWQVVGVEPQPTTSAAQRYERSLKRSPQKLAVFKKRMLTQTAAGRQQQVVG